MAIKVTTTGQTTFVKKIILGTPIRSVVQTTGTLVGLQDVTLTNKRHDEFLRYDSASGQFVNTDSATLNNLSVSTNLTTGKVASDLIPSQDSAFDLGSSTNKWKDLFLSGNTISLGSIQLKDSSGGLVVVDSDGTPSKFSVSEIRGLFSASGDLTYNSSTGVFEFDVEQVYTKDNFDSDFNDALDSAALGGTGLTFNSASNTLDITNTGVVAATYGSASEVPVLKINAQGQIDSAGSTQVAGVTSVAFDSASQNFTISTADGGTFVKMISNRMPSASAGAYGSASKVPIVTVNQYGLVDSIGTTLVAGVTGFIYDSSSGLLTISTADGNTFTDSINLNPFNTSTLSEGTNLYYTTARSDSDFDIRLATKSTTNLSEGNNLYYTTTRADSAFDARFDSSFDERLATKSTSNLSEGSNLYFTTGRADARVNLQTGSNLDLSSKSTSNLSEGNNLYYTTARADSAFDTRFDSSFDERLTTKSTTNLSEGSNLYFTTGRADARVNLQTGANLDLSSKSTSDLSEGTNLYFTTARADSDAKNAISGGTGISYNSSTGSITTNDAQIDHDTLSNFVPNEHINHSNVSIIAGSGLLGGGDLTSSRTINIDSANVRVMFSGETGVTYNTANGEISIGQDVGTSANVTFNQVRGPAEFIIDPATIGDNSGTVRILGNLTVEGTTTTINSTDVSVNDKTFRIADSAADSSGLAGAGIVFGGASITANKPSFKYNHAQERFDFNRKISADGSALTNIPAGQLTGTIDNARISLDAAEIPNLAASKITSGLLDSARLQPLNINASYVSTGTLGDARIPNLAASKITSGLFDSARIPPIAMNASYITTGTFTNLRTSDSAIFDGDGASGGISLSDGLIDIRTGTGLVSQIRFYCEDNNAHFQTLQAAPHIAGSSAVIVLPTASGTLLNTDGSGASLTNLNASQLSSGTVPSARLSLSASDIPNLAASKITSGLFDSARLQPLAMNASYISTGTLSSDRIPNLAASKINSGSLDSARLPLGVSFHGAGGGGGGGTATDITISANNSTDESVFLTFVDGATGTQGLETDTSLTYNPSTNTLSIGAGGDALTIDDAGTITANGNTLVLNSTSATALQHNGNTKLQTGSGGIDVNGSVIVGTGDTFTLDGSETTTSSTSQTALVTVAKATYGAAKFLVTAVSSSERHITEIYATHDGTTGVATEYGTVTTNGILATYDVDINGDNFRLLATPASSTSTTFKVVQTLIEA